MTKTFDPIHAICVRLRDQPCKLCPAQEPSPYGPMTRGCYALARECLEIARHGNPWGAETPSGTVDRWQKDFNAE